MGEKLGKDSGDKEYSSLADKVLAEMRAKKEAETHPKTDWSREDARLRERRAKKEQANKDAIVDKEVLLEEHPPASQAEEAEDGAKAILEKNLKLQERIARGESITGDERDFLEKQAEAASMWRKKK